MQLILASQSLGRKKLLELTDIPFQIIHSTLDEEKIVGKTPLETIKLRAKLKGEEVFKKIQNPKSQVPIKSKIPNRELTTNNHKLLTNYIILSADSGAIIDNQLIGKPRDYEDAVRILQTLSGRIHELITAVYFISISRSRVQFSKTADETYVQRINNGKRNMILKRVQNYNADLEFRDFAGKKIASTSDTKIKICHIYDRSHVTFKPLSLTTIKQYLAHSDYLRFAGGYALFDHPDLIKPTLSDLLSNKSYKEILKPVNPELHPNYLDSLDLIADITGSISNVIGLPLEKVIPILKRY